MTASDKIYIGLATADSHTRLEAFFDISVERQRRIGTFVVLFSMVEQQLEFVLLQRSEVPLVGEIPFTDRMTISDRLKAIRALAGSEPLLTNELVLAAELGEVLADARHTVAHGAPLESGRLERNRSWFGETRKRPFASLQLTDAALDATACATEILFRLLGSIGSRLAGHDEMADLMTPSEDQLSAAKQAAVIVRQAMAESS